MLGKPVIGTKTMVVSPHYLASAAGARILEQGGNAYDAAVAVSACLAVVYPHMTGLGGDAFWLTYCTDEGQVRAYNGSGRSAYGVSRDSYEGESSIPKRGIRSAITVPGMVDSWDAILQQYGRLTLSEVLVPALEYALEGFPLSPDQWSNCHQAEASLIAEPLASAIYIPGGRIPHAGERFVQLQLATTLRKIREGGRDAFYKGEIAATISDYMFKSGGFLTREDFADHKGNWVEPISTDYQGYTVYQVPPNSQGFTALMSLNILENFNFKGIEHGSYEYFHLLVEALKLSFRDRDQVLTDPAFSHIPLGILLNKSYSAKLASTISFQEASKMTSEPVGRDTAYAAVVDEEGNAVSFIQSLYFEFGSGVVAGDTGILLQNRGSFFSLDPLAINTLEPHKRTFHTLMPAMACKNGKPAILYGTQGGEGQPQTQTMLLTRMLHYGMNPQQAVEEPRFVWGRTWGEPTNELKLESRVPEFIRRELAAAGHIVRTVGAYDGIVGHAHMIGIDANGFRQGGSDPRCDGAAIGW
ncbi:gamma-glutamyltransferase [Paenibacillus crassostreae]|uniref:Glutathione hydrolase proenzyme n=1 Tax=Paenibacillus crassostreae TaxID=1763538 RepID=A0A167B597_9BACL|nr:gamma-glutamyltransferase [Paenibacillus crassostreae]AOZ93158.1 gamma-glutamyltransferase [Paenibacillus crassostreae]OAB71752.1 gamma-glutamyltranspeptidase [Paenibacillus crassostreae]